MTVIEEIERSSAKLVVMVDEPVSRKAREQTLSEAGFGQVDAFPTHPDNLEDHMNHGEHKTVDLLLYGLESASENCWENLGGVRKLFKGPVLLTTEHDEPGVRDRIAELEIHDYLCMEGCCEESLELKVETALSSHRINAMIEDNDHRAQRLFVNILTVMVKILESKDHYTRFHSHSVALWSRMIGRKLGLDEEELIRLGLAAVFHDFGKIGIPEEVLNKPSRLNDEEFTVMKQHPTIARDLLSSLDLFSDLLPAITHHHERWDGRGYPAGIKSDQIPLWARIICIADAYDTMASRRTYKAPMPTAAVIGELKRNSGTQFDPKLVEIMLDILAEKEAEAKKQI